MSRRNYRKTYKTREYVPGTPAQEAARKSAWAALRTKCVAEHWSNADGAEWLADLLGVMPWHAIVYEMDEIECATVIELCRTGCFEIAPAPFVLQRADGQYLAPISGYVARLSKARVFGTVELAKASRTGPDDKIITTREAMDASQPRRDAFVDDEPADAIRQRNPRPQARRANKTKARGNRAAGRKPDIGSVLGGG